MRRSLVIYDFATDPSEFPNIYEENFILCFINVVGLDGFCFYNFYNSQADHAYYYTFLKFSVNFCVTVHWGYTYT
jgi:hypothetical protein